MGTEFLKIMDSEDVQDIVNNMPVKRKTKKISLIHAYKRVLAEDIRATIDLPPFNKALMDGYAVKAEDTFGASEDNPAILKLVGDVRAGEVAKKAVEKGTCIEISTGAPVPEGTEGIVMVEYTENKEGKIYIYDDVAFGQNIAKQGSDVTKNDILLTAGTLLTHDKIGVLAAVGAKEVLVFNKPKIAVISTGNEIVEYNQKLEYGKIYDINSQTIANAVKPCGCIPIYSGIVKDNYENLKNNIEQNLGADIIITSGGTSAGAGDVLRAVLDDMGEVFVHGIAVKPGKPTIIGMIGDKPIFGLPGNPAAALIVFHVFVAPYLRKMTSLKTFKKSDILKLKISRRYHSSRGRQQYVLVKVRDDVAHPILKDSGSITAIAEADGYFKIPKNVEIIQEGSEIEVVLLENS